MPKVTMINVFYRDDGINMLSILEQDFRDFVKDYLNEYINYN